MRAGTEFGGVIRTARYYCLHCDRIYLTPPWLQVPDEAEAGPLLHLCVEFDRCGGAGVGIDLFEVNSHGEVR